MGGGGYSRARSANNSVPKTKDGGNSIIGEGGGGGEQWKPTGALNGMLFHFLNCFPFGIMYARHPLLQGLAKRIHTYSSSTASLASTRE